MTLSKNGSFLIMSQRLEHQRLSRRAGGLFRILRRKETLGRNQSQRREAPLAPLKVPSPASIFRFRSSSPAKGVSRIGRAAFNQMGSDHCINCSQPLLLELNCVFASQSDHKYQKHVFYNPPECDCTIGALPLTIKRKAYGFRVRSKDEDFVLSLKVKSGQAIELRLGDQLKFATHSMRLKEIQTLPWPTRDVQYQQGQQSCRICFLSRQSEEDPLLEFCKCMGSIAKTHLYCMRAWYDSKNLVYRACQNCVIREVRQVRCDICLEPFPPSILLNQQETLLYGLHKFATPCLVFREPSALPDFQFREFYINGVEGMVKLPLSALQHRNKSSVYEQGSLMVQTKDGKVMVRPVQCDVSAVCVRGCDLFEGSQEILCRKEANQLLLTSRIAPISSK